MSTFTTPLEITPSEKNGFWKLLSAFSYCIEEKTRSIVINVPAGFETDFASIPKLFWNILPPFGSYGKSAIIHDFLYSEVSDGLKFSRQESDHIFLQAMKVLKTPYLIRNSMWLGVRVFGWLFYKKRKQTNKDLQAVFKITFTIIDLRKSLL